ncbi:MULTISPECIES: adenylyl-sulfate kinase [unclassified Pseudofrankia]|nr:MULTISPECIES: adenylyl-sulfate kinase [unclassified Pseudofrankia]MDT3440438.1 adenylyl-sulfate kinase [Pseudofrankia sp. BMG5.37]
MTTLVILGVLVLSALLGWLFGPDTRDPDYSMSAERPPRVDPG